MDDDIVDVEREAQKHLPAPSWGGTEGNQSKIYLCPNGHPYLISDCGRAYTQSTCVCGAEIGGRQHETATGNTELDEEGQQKQRTKSGHILGRASDRSQTAQPQRDLSPMSCAILRAITHITMLLSALFNGNQKIFKYVIKVAEMIQEEKPSDDEICDYLVDHINLDIAQIADCSKRNIDDCYILLHEVITSLQEDACSAGNMTLQNITERGEWEKKIYSVHIHPVVAYLDIRLACVRSRLEGDCEGRFRAAISAGVDMESEGNIMALPCLWRYKRPVTLAFISCKIENRGKELFALSQVVEQCDELCAIECLPEIIELIHYLSENLHSKISRKQAQGMTMKEFLVQSKDQETIDCGRLKTLIKSLIFASDVMVQKGHSEDSGTQGSFRPLSLDSPLAEFLYDKRALKPGNNDVGSAPFIIVSYLVSKHNNVLRAVHHHMNTNSESDTTRTWDVSRSLNDVMPSHLVSLTHPDEVLHLVLAHSEYDIEDPSNVEFNWAAMEQEVIVKYFGNRPTILHCKTDLPSYMYSDDFNLHSQMTILGETQERLDTDSHANVSGGLNQSVQALTDSLKEVEVVVNFLAISVSDNLDMEQSMLSFMKSIFGEAREFLYLTPDVKLKHVKHVWFILRFAQAGLLANQRQEPFDDVEPSYREGLIPEARRQLQEFCSYRSILTKVLLQELFEFVIMKLNRTSASNVYEQPNPKAPLYNLLRLFVEEQHYENPKMMNQILDDLPKIPPIVETNHAAKAWAFIWACYNQPPSTQALPHTEV